VTGKKYKGGGGRGIKKKIRPTGGERRRWRESTERERQTEREIYSARVRERAGERERDRKEKREERTIIN
jgi:hypothetical protein